VSRQRSGSSVHPLQSSYGAYGKERVTTVALFAQAVYLLFAAVYVCKEAMEHFLLSAGEGHHHHAGDEDTNTA
jgi:divalent metal cation (Fe/Co/Zn/Cd) transporter